MSLAFLSDVLKSGVCGCIYNSLIIPVSGLHYYPWLAVPRERASGVYIQVGGVRRSLPCIRPSHLTKTKVIIPRSVKQKKMGSASGSALLAAVLLTRRESEIEPGAYQKRGPAIGRLRVYYLHTHNHSPTGDNEAFKGFALPLGPSTRACFMFMRRAGERARAHCSWDTLALAWAFQTRQLRQIKEQWIILQNLVTHQTMEILLT